MVNLFKVLATFNIRNQNRGFREQAPQRKYVTNPQNNQCNLTFKQVMENVKKSI